ncbi:MAG: DNA-binding response regulator [Marinobacter sp.]|nr:DNA-binding response regulator [Marinobacter sp.]MDX1754612.1 DNA-binding response regulator [Marinobacter sp.]
MAEGEDPIPAIQQHDPVAVCYQFDYPDQSGLLELRQTKQALPSVPLLMITQSHSEQLAVWAFRSHVWDYFVQPVDTARFIDVVDTLSAIHHGKPAAAARAALDAKNSIPPEARLRCVGVSVDRSIMDQILTYLNANLHKKIVQAEVAERFGLSPFQFSRLFKRLSDMTFQSYLLTRRIEEAKRLLANPKVSVTDICFTVGFHDLSYFTRIFQRHVGLPPSRYRVAQAEQAAAAEAAASVEKKHRSVELVSAKS